MSSEPEVEPAPEAVNAEERALPQWCGPGLLWKSEEEFWRHQPPRPPPKLG